MAETVEPQLLEPLSAKLEEGGVLVCFLEKTASQDVVTAELKVLKAFVAAWNEANPTEHAHTLLITASQHISTLSAKDQPPHITLHVSTTEQWAGKPQKRKYTAHVFSQENDVHKGYLEYGVHDRKAANFSPAFQKKVDAAVANYKGVLGDLKW
ncbi:hypothetical protein FPV67DRAFT_1672790 [Lyophyllum atratum]|nr:hypothetical protein FPV67DRAFT_1672790 [Lyophyllum atratum]